LRAKGHGEFREIVQDEFLKEVTGSDLVLVHFYHRDFERCKIMDMHLGRLAPGHVECKFLKINAEKAPFFVDKLKIRMLPTIICFKDGVAFNDRIIGFEGLVSEEEEELDTFGTRSYRQKARSDNFKTSQLARRLAEIGVIKHSDLDEDEEVEKESNVKRKEYIEDF
jgi:thioredoxin-like negative regulator of GroEL